jgi:hypothetical protein
MDVESRGREGRKRAHGGGRGNEQEREEKRKKEGRRSGLVKTNGF